MIIRGKKRCEKLEKEKITRKQRSFQKTFLQFEQIDDGIVKDQSFQRLYVNVQAVNPSLMREVDKEDVMKDLSSIITMFEKAQEVSLHVIDKQADVSSNIELVRLLRANNDNHYIKSYMKEQEKGLEQARESGTERLFFLCVTYDREYDYESVLAEARQLNTLDSIFSMRLMTKQEIMKIFAVYCTRTFCDYTGKEDIVVFKNSMTPIRTRFLPTHAQVGDLHVKTLVVRKYPQKANKLILLERLSKLHGVDITLRLNKIDEMKISAGIDKTFQASKQMVETANKETEKLESRKKYEDLSKMYERMLTENEYMYALSLFIQVKALSFEELQEIERRVLRELQMISFIKETPQLLQQEAWFSCAPFGSNKLFKLVSRNVPLSTVSCLMPFVYSGRKDKHGQLIGEDNAGGKMLVDLEKKDNEVTNTNVMIIGESGQGKTRLEHMLILQKYARGNLVFIEDPEREHSVLVHKLGGTYIQPGGRYLINPLEVFKYRLMSVGEETLYGSKVSHLRQHISWVIEFFKAYNSEINSDLLSILLEQFYVQRGYSLYDDTHNEQLSSPVLSEFYQYIIDELETGKSQQKIERSKKSVTYHTLQLKMLIQQVHGVCVGNDSDLCNGQTRMAKSDIIAWDLNDLLAGSKQRLRIMQHVISGYVWNQVVRNRYSRKVTYIISELSLRLHKENIDAIMPLVSMLKRFRKYESDLVMSTQNPYDMLRSGIREYTAPLFTSPAFRFLFYPGDGNREEFMKTVNITEAEYSKIAKSKRGNVLFTAGATKYNVQISPLTKTEEIVYGKGVGN